MPGIIGQRRAVNSIGFGLDTPYAGYNIFLSGPTGVGRETAAKRLAGQKAEKQDAPDDWCYVFNFANHDQPKAISLPAGTGRKLVRDMDQMKLSIFKHLPKVFASEEYEESRQRMMSEFYENAGRMYMDLEQVAHHYGMGIARTQAGITTVPIVEGRPLTIEEFNELPDEQKKEYMEPARLIQDKVNESLRHYRDLEKTLRERLYNLDQETARKAIAPYFAALFDGYRRFEKVVEHLEAMQYDMIQNLDVFLEQEESQNPLLMFKRIERKHLMRRYRINLVVDNAETRHAPVIVESNPTYTNLFGSMEYEGEFGVLSTDFTRIRAGALHRANGGYLIVHFLDLIRNLMVWETLKRTLKNQEICVESLMKSMSLGQGETLQPEPIPLNVKLIVIGEPMIYYLLHTHDEDFSKLFKIKAEFDTEMDRTSENIYQYAAYASCIIRDEKLMDFTAAGIARVVDYGAWLADDQAKLSTQFNMLRDILCEACVWAGRDGKKMVDAAHVERAIAEKNMRSSIIEEKIVEMIEDDMLMIDVSGRRIGEINGLAVYSIGDYHFGKPSRITAKTFIGEKGVVNIERETRMSGAVHSKGVLTLSGYLGGKYAKDKPLSLSASVTFEQMYEGIEGDSASSTELYAIISSLADLPIDQGIAVTGSVNQNGEIQPIGGVNQKIEGFFKVCRLKGLTGEQGVIIPRQNVRNLMLAEDVIKAVQQGKFHIWAIDNVDQGIQILMKTEAGTTEAPSEYAKDSVHDRVNRRLWEMIESRRRGADARRSRTDYLARRVNHKRDTRGI